MASPPKPSTLPAAQVRQYSWHHCVKNDVSDTRREYVGANKRTNRVTPFLSQQAPHVSRVHLLKVIKKIGKHKRSKGKHLTDFRFKTPHLRRGKDMTSLLLPGQKSERGSLQYSVMCEYNSSETSLFNHEYQYTNKKWTLKRSKAKKKEQEAEFKPPGSTNYDDIESDVTEQDINKPIARKRYEQKHSFVSEKGCSKRSYSQTFTKAARILAIVISILGGLCNIKLPERKSPIGTSPSLSPSETRVVLCFHNSSVLSNLREIADNIIGINEELCSCIDIETSLNNNKPIIRGMKVLQNTINREERGYVYPGYATYDLATFARNVYMGRCLYIYIFLSVEFCTFRVDYLDTYIVNLVSDDRFTVFYKLIYVYIRDVPSG